MFRRKEIASVYLVMNVLFYMGIAGLVLDIGNGMGYIAQVLVMSGLLVSCVPDLLINMDMAEISIINHRMDLVEKVLLILISDFYVQEKNIVLILVVACIGSLNLVSVYTIFRKMKGIDVINTIEKLKNLEDKGLEKQLGYFIGNCINVALFLNMQDSMFEIVLWGIVCIGVHFYISERIVKNLKKTRKVSANRYRVIFLGIHLAIMLVSIMQIANICYILEGIYGMVIINSTLQNKTALIKLKKQQEDEL